MKTLLLAVMAVCLPALIYAQDFTGLWTGTMKNDSTGQVQDYEVFISKEKGKYIGYSHTWFDIDGEKYYGVKKLKISIAKDGKIVVLDGELKENNYPFKDKYVKQLNVLDQNGSGETAELTGLFVTNCTKSFYELTGKVQLKKADAYTSSRLMRFLEKESNGAVAVTAVK
jgi:hypothetical protein